MISAGVLLGAPTPNQPLASIARHEFAHGRNVRQASERCRRRHRQCAQLAGLDVLDR